MRQCVSLVDISALASCAALEEVVLSGCPLLADVTALAELPRVRHVNLELCTSIRGGLLLRGGSCAAHACRTQAQVVPPRAQCGAV